MAFESTRSASNLSLKRSRMTPLMSFASWWTGAGAFWDSGPVLDLLPSARSRRSNSVSSVFLGDFLAHRPDDDPARVLGEDLTGHLPQLRALVAPLDLAAHPDVRGERHVDEETPRKRDLGGQPGPFVLIGSFVTWTRISWPFLQVLLDGRELPGPAPASAAPFRPRSRRHPGRRRRSSGPRRAESLPSRSRCRRTRPGCPAVRPRRGPGRCRRPPGSDPDGRT